MTEKQKKINNLLWNFQSLREEQIMKICDCTEEDINYLIASKAITKDNKTRILNCNNSKEINNRNVVAFDVVMEYLDRKPKIKKVSRHVNVRLETAEYTYDIITVKEDETEAIFEKIDSMSKADRLIIIIETKNDYQRKFINTKKPCYICTYPPLEIVDRIN